MTTQEIRSKVDQLKGQRFQIEKSLKILHTEVTELKRTLRRHEQAREIVREVGLKTQQQLQYHIGDITSMALDSVFEDPYELKVNFVQRRNKTECDLTFVRDGFEIDPIDAAGVGAIDIASFSLRIASWSMMYPRTRNTIILDEPFRFLSTNYQERASQMIKELSQKLGLQFIIVTHEEELTASADKIFQVSKDKKTKISHVN
jgi:DNA repair exonuclease SbcCD ATPase subunit